MQTSKRVLVIGLDGATWDVLEPWIRDGTLPNLARIRGSGSWGPLISSVPPITAAAWSTFMTGKRPGKHGVYHFVNLFDDDDAGLGMPGADRTRGAADGITGDDSGAATRAGSYGADAAGTPAIVVRSRGAPGAQLLVGLRSNRLSSSTRRGGLPLVPASRLTSSSGWSEPGLKS